MKEPIVRGVRYRIGKIPARRQWDILRRIGPLLEGLVPALQKVLAENPGASAEDIALACAGPLMGAFQKMTDADSNYIIDHALAVVQREGAEGRWSPVMANGAMMFEADDNLFTILALTAHAVWENVGSFLSDLPGALPALPGTPAT